MDITIVKEQSRVLVAVLQLSGILDGSNHMHLVDEAKKIHLNGLRDLLIDLSKLTFMNSSGLSAIQKTALLFRDPPKVGEETSQASFHKMDREHVPQVHSHVKLLSPQPRVSYILYVAGFDLLFEIHTDLNAALASF